MSRNGPKLLSAIVKSKLCRYCSCCTCDGCRSNNNYCCKKHRLLRREVLAVVLNSFEVVICFAIAFGYIYHLSGEDVYSKLEERFGSDTAESFFLVYNNFNMLILPFGSLSTILLLPFEDYVSDSIEETPNNPGSGVSTSHDRELSRSLLSNSLPSKHSVVIEMAPTLDSVNTNDNTPLLDAYREDRLYKTFPPSLVGLGLKQTMPAV